MAATHPNCDGQTNDRAYPSNDSNYSANAEIWSSAFTTCIRATPLALLLLVGEVEGVEGAAAAVEVGVDAAFPFPQTDCPPSYTISAIVSCKAPGAYSVHMV